MQKKLLLILTFTGLSQLNAGQKVKFTFEQRLCKCVMDKDLPELQKMISDYNNSRHTFMNFDQTIQTVLKYAKRIGKVAESNHKLFGKKYKSDREKCLSIIKYLKEIQKTDERSDTEDHEDFKYF